MKTSNFKLQAPSLHMANIISAKIAKPGTLLHVFMPAVLIIAGVAALAISAHIKVPLYPVPITMQTLMVMVIAMSYGSALGGATMFSYLFAGFLGAPVFATGAGFAYLMGPTGGYLVSYFVVAVSLGWLAERGWAKSWQTAAASMLIGTAIIYLFGVLWLSQFTGLSKAVEVGMLPFLYGDALKLIIAAVGVPFIWRLVQKLI